MERKVHRIRLSREDLLVRLNCLVTDTRQKTCRASTRDPCHVFTQKCQGAPTESRWISSLSINFIRWICTHWVTHCSERRAAGCRTEDQCTEIAFTVFLLEITGIQ
nr:uncharacterized protein LOC126528928 isoform X2 [Dermacentor andersoni]